MRIKVIIITLYLFFTNNVYSQINEIRIHEIDSIKHYIEENEDNRSIFYTINADGQSVQIKKRCYFFKKVIQTGGFSETYILKDTFLVSLTVGTGTFPNENCSVGTDIVEFFIFENDNLCYYKQDFYNEIDNANDTLIYEIELYLLDEKIIKYNIKGKFSDDLEVFKNKTI